MQVERESGFGREKSGARVSNAWIICLCNRNNDWKRSLIPDTLKFYLLRKDDLYL